MGNLVSSTPQSRSGMGGTPLQKAEMPEASEKLLGKIYQFVGTTDSNYTNGYFYKCVSDGQETPTYSWSRINVQPSGGSGGSSDFEELEHRPSYNGAVMTRNTSIPEVKTTTWDGKYAKPATGIPSTDMAEAVQTSLGLADSALQESDIAASVSAQSTDAEPVSAKCVYDLVGNVESLLAALL